jgi:hypothetical protein
MVIRAALLAAAVVFTTGAQAQSAKGTVSWFMANDADRRAMLQACADDEALARRPVCANAVEASNRVARARRAAAMARTPSPSEVLNDPRYWASNRMARAGALVECNGGGLTNLTPRACAAARLGAAMDGQ